MTNRCDDVARPSGPLTSLRAIELAGIGPGPFAAMMLADMGATVIRVDRAEAVRADRPAGAHPDVLNRGRRSIGVDLKSPEGRDTVLALVADADVLIEGFRPGVTERLGIGPDECLARNPALVYGRMTGWGQSGPWANYAGHDINYIALTGALHACGRAGEVPVPPMNLVGDFGGGGLMLAFGVVSAVVEARRTGAGQVVDAAMVDGASVLTTAIHGLRNRGVWTGQRGENLLDTGAPFYEVYECADGKYVAVGAIEPQFYAELIRRTGFEEDPARRTGCGLTAGPQRRSGGPPCSARRRGTSGPPWLRSRTRAWPRCWTGTRHPPIPISRSGGPISSTRACSSRLPRPGSVARRPPFSARLPTRASTPTRFWESWGSTRARSPRFGGPEPCDSHGFRLL